VPAAEVTEQKTERVGKGGITVPINKGGGGKPAMNQKKRPNTGRHPNGSGTGPEKEGAWGGEKRKGASGGRQEKRGGKVYLSTHTAVETTSGEGEWPTRRPATGVFKKGKGETVLTNPEGVGGGKNMRQSRNRGGGKDNTI